jgi:hypothetical protein
MTGPQQARIFNEFEEMFCMPHQQTPNHAQGHATLITFKKQINTMYDVILTMGNSYMDSCNELMTLDIHERNGGSATTLNGTFAERAVLKIL